MQSKSKFTYNNQRIAFDKKGHWSFDNEISRNVTILGSSIIVHYLILTIQKVTF